MAGHGLPPDQTPEISLRIFRFSMFKSAGQPQGEYRVNQWSGLVRDLFTTPRLSADKDGPLFSPAIYNNTVYRADENVTAIGALVYDFDCKDPANATRPEDQADNLDGLTYAWYSTFSNAANLPRWRLVIPLDRDVGVHEYAALWQGGLRLLGEDPNIDLACRNPSRNYWLPTCPPDKQAIYFCGSVKGAWAKADELIELSGIQPGLPLPANVIQAPVGGRSRPVDPQLERDLWAALEHIDPDCGYDEWMRIGAACHSLDNDDVGFLIWDTWSRNGASYAKNTGANSTAYMWRSFSSNRPGGVTHKTIFHMAQARGWKNGRADAPQGSGALPVAAEVAAELPPLGLQAFDACDLQNEAVEPVEWAWENWLPKRYTSGIFAEGGTGKSLLVLQLAVCRAAQIPFIDGQVPPPGKTLLLFCEDDRRIVNMRLHKIMARYALPWSTIQGKIKILCRVGDDNSLMSFDKGAGTLTPFWHQLRALLATERADLLVLDTRNDTFTGNEIDGNQVRQFITRAMTSLAQEFNLAAVFLSHVSVSGKSTGTGISGHGQWRDAARSQIYLHRNELLPTISVNRKKANHASANQSDTVQIYNDAGFLIPEMDIDLTQQIDEIARDAFLKILDIQLGYGTPVSSNIRANDDAYAPKVFHQYAKNTRMKPLPTVEDFTRAMQQLEQEGLIRIGSDPRGKAKFLISRAES